MHYHCLIFQELRRWQVLVLCPQPESQEAQLNSFLSDNNVWEQGISELPSVAAFYTLPKAGHLMTCSHMLRGFPSVQMQRLNLLISQRVLKNQVVLMGFI